MSGNASRVQIATSVTQLKTELNLMSFKFVKRQRQNRRGSLLCLFLAVYVSNSSYYRISYTHFLLFKLKPLHCGSLCLHHLSEAQLFRSSSQVLHFFSPPSTFLPDEVYLNIWTTQSPTYIFNFWYLFY